MVVLGLNCSFPDGGDQLTTMMCWRLRNEVEDESVQSIIPIDEGWIYLDCSILSFFFFFF
jgi:hypothetical protein